MSLYAALLQLALVYIVMAMVPGPNTVVISYYAARTSRQAGLKAVAGIVIGSTIWVILSMMGVGLLLLEAGVIYNTLRLAGAAYLIYVGVRLLMTGAGSPATQRPAQDARSPLVAGLLTNLANPKSAVFWTSVFVTLVPAHAPVWFYGAIVLMIGVLATAWYSTVALTLSSSLARRHYGRFGQWLDRIAGVVMIGLGLKLANEIRGEVFR